MTETKWTPGPWRIDDMGLVVNGRETRQGFGEVSIGIFDAGEWPRSLMFEAQANAYLIAAAPELYEAAASCLDYALLHEILDRPTTLDNDVFAIRVSDLRKLRAALAKARGEA